MPDGPSKNSGYRSFTCFGFGRLVASSTSRNLANLGLDSWWLGEHVISYFEAQRMIIAQAFMMTVFSQSTFGCFSLFCWTWGVLQGLFYQSRVSELKAEGHCCLFGVRSFRFLPLAKGLLKNNDRSSGACLLCVSVRFWRACLGSMLVYLIFSCSNRWTV